MVGLHEDGSWTDVLMQKTSFGIQSVDQSRIKLLFVDRISTVEIENRSILHGKIRTDD